MSRLAYRVTVALFFLSGAACTSSAPERTGGAPIQLSPVQSLSNLSQRLLAAHNRERAAVGVPPLVWDDRLAAASAVYAPMLATRSQLEHSPAHMRVGQGENLWTGTRGAFSLENMVADWASEKRMFRPGLFPNVTTSGNWADVGHYTQIIWRGTTHVGCAVHQTPRWDFLVCRYSPPGNVTGQQVP